jgi:gamma-glutamyltranspeptidase / glutathione hydrolase
MAFTTRPDIRGTFGVVASTHWIASAVGMSVLECGGNAFDAAVATGLVLQVLEPHLNGPAGDMPALVYDAKSDAISVVCGQGTAPAGATIAHYRGLGLDLVPGSGLLATVIPGAFDAWMLMLRNWGTWPVADVLEPAIHYAATGHPVLPRVAETIAALAPFFAAHWPSSAATWTPAGRAPEPHSLFSNKDLAATYRRIAGEASAAPSREAGIDAARRAWSQGFVAETIDTWLRTAELPDDTNRPHRAVLTGADMAAWQATVEPPLSKDFGSWTVHKTGPWGQGPVLLQSLALLHAAGIADTDPTGPDFIHLVVEAMKLAYADREAYYGDPAQSDIPINDLLSDSYAAERARLIGAQASLDLRPGRLPGYERLAEASVARARIDASGAAQANEPTMAHLARRGDTVHLDVIDRWGNMVSATPSGGWLQSSPVVPSLGFPLNSRAQMFWLDEGLPTSLAPGRRPRTTLSPSLASLDGRPTLAFGTPGGDQQDQWQLVLFLRHALYGMGLQAAIDAPLFHSGHLTSSFHPRTIRPGYLVVEESAGEVTLADLRRRGHDVDPVPAWTAGRLTAARRDPDGRLTAAATPRLMQAYAIGR